MKNRIIGNQLLGTRCRIYSKEHIIANMIGKEKSVLDCGCGDGKIAQILKKAGCHVVGIEIEPTSSKIAGQFCHRVIVGNLEEKRTFEQLDGSAFDCVLFSDVLEHLVNPRKVITRYAGFLRPSGHFIVSLPNVAYWRIRLHLLWGRWDLSNEGILDETHLHYFTLRTSLNLFSRAGLEVVELRVPHDPRGGWPRRLVVRAVHRLTSPNFHAAGVVFKLIPNTMMKVNNGDSINS